MLIISVRIMDKSYHRFSQGKTGNALVSITSFSEEEFILRQFIHNLITLILKIENAATKSQFQQISLCNVINNANSKILANLLKPLLPRYLIGM